MVTALLLSLLAHGSDLPAQDALSKGFQNPPDSAKPHTWWHWMDGNVSKEGITADLEAMKQVGIGGAQMFTVAVGIPAGKVGYMSPQWREMTTHAVKEANRVGIELCIHNCAGWSSSGGPWITPEYAMQVIAWSEKNVHGPTRFSEVLPQPKPPIVYRSVPYYKDIAVFAYPTPSTAPMGRDQLIAENGSVRADGLQPNLAGGNAGAITDLRVLTGKMDKSGRLVWEVPAGDWTILRMGHTPTGKDNHPAPPEGDGLEVDKLSREALDVHWRGMMAKVLADIGPLAGTTLNNSLIDSYEVGSQNWTPKFAQEFKRRRGYDLMPYMPVIAGRVVKSKEISERFLWDFRRTIADLYADNYFGYFGQLCHKAGLKFSTEPYGNGGFDNVQCGGLSDIPMGEFWVNGGAIETTKLASSVGHVYNRPVIGAESFTADDVSGRWLIEPYGVKALGDKIFCNGINRYIFHRYAHQPWMNLKPGMTMGPWGTHLERTVTWWNEASEWMRYIARCQYLLQQGKFVADALYFYGEGAPVDLPYRPNLSPAIPDGYDYDGCDATTVMKLKVKNGRLVLPDGMSYRMLILPNSLFMTPAMVKKIGELARGGAMIYGTKPTKSPSLVGYPKCDLEVQAVANAVWPRYVRSAESVAWQSSPRDFEYTGSGKLAYIHRVIGDVDVYFVSNQQYRLASVECKFRTSGSPTLWHPDTGQIEDAPVYSTAAGGTVVPLRLGPAESVFVVFRKGVATSRVQTVTFTGMPEQQPHIPIVVVTRACYETADGKGADVTQIVQRMVADGEYEIPATNSLFGDPALNIVKRLVVDYTLDGTSKHSVVAENQTLVLVEMPDGSLNMPPYELHKTADGKLILTPWEAGTIRISATQQYIMTKPATSQEVIGPWEVTFPPGWGAPGSTTMPGLTSWSENLIEGVKYFSGTATYHTTLTISPDMLGSNKTVLLDLGRVKNFATVRLNGKKVAVLWKAPFRVDIGAAAKAGDNVLEVDVTNLWPNRLIGDEQLPPDAEWNGQTLKKWPDWLTSSAPRPQTGRFTFTTWRFYNKDSQLLESGLLGPVVVRSATNIIVSVP